jgi:serine phosphatase RsbU (regulator of sigma subunit)
MPRSSPRAGLRTSTTTVHELARLHHTALPRAGTISGPFDLACWSRPVHVIGGDLMDACPLGRDRLLIFLGDVMGHDLTAAVIASAVRLDLYRAREAGLHSPAAYLRHLDRGVSALFRGHFVTAACCLLDARAGTLTWSLAGHPPILLTDGQGGVRCLHHRAYPLGLQAEDRYHDEVTAFLPGAAVVLYSDGVSEPLGSPDYPGAEVLSGLLSGLDLSADDMVRIIRQAVRPLRRTDDRSILAVRLKGE